MREALRLEQPTTPVEALLKLEPTPFALDEAVAFRQSVLMR